MTEPRGVPVAEVKRSFREVLNRALGGEATVVLRHGRPVAVVGPPPTEETRLPRARRPGGLLALQGLFGDWETMEEDMAEVLAARASAADRQPPDLG